MAVVALIYSLADSVVYAIWPSGNELVAYHFWYIFSRSIGIYFIYLAVPALISLGLFLLIRNIRRFKDTRHPIPFVFLSGALAFFVWIAIAEINNQLDASFVSLAPMAINIAGLILWFALSLILIPLGLSWLNERLPKAVKLGFSILSYAALLFISVLLFFILLLPLMTHPRGNEDLPNVLVISIDTLRKDHLSYYGYEPIETKNIDRFLKKSTEFRNAYCSSPWTLPSFASFVTGHRPSVSAVDDNHAISPYMVTIAEHLRKNGYRTEAYIGNTKMNRELRFDSGFDYFLYWRDLRILSPFDDTRMYRYTARFYKAIFDITGRYPSDNEYLADYTCKALERYDDEPFFIWCHFLDPHFPYLPPDNYIRDISGIDNEEVIKFRHTYEQTEVVTVEKRYSNKMMALYDAEILFVDDNIGRILDTLERTGHDKDTVVILFNDHGEAFFDHGHWGHSKSVYPEEIDMVLGYYNPFVNGAINSSGKYVSHINIAPTIYESLGIDPPGGLPGESFYNDLTSPDSLEGPVFCEYTMWRYPDYRGVRKDGYLFIKNYDNGEMELYDIQNDPTATKNLIDENPERAAELEIVLSKQDEQNQTEKLKYRPGDTIVTTEGFKDQMKGLGYF